MTIERCRLEIAAIETELLAGNPDVAGLLLALSDWNAEWRILENEKSRQGEPGGVVETTYGNLSFDRVTALPVLGFHGSEAQTQFLSDGPRQEAAHGMRLPTRCLHQLLQRGSAILLQKLQYLCSFAAVPRAFDLFPALGRFLAFSGLLPRLRLLGRNVRALCASTGAFLGFRLRGSLGGLRRFYDRCHLGFSFGGDYRSDDIHCSDPLRKQANSAEGDCVARTTEGLNQEL
jgi:hypothetical protein